MNNNLGVIMFGNRDEYENATRHAQVNTYVESNSVNGKMIVLNLLLLMVIGYVIFFFTQTEGNEKTAVLGVSITADEVNRDEATYLKLLKSSEVDTVKENSQQMPLDSLNNSMKVLMNESTIQSSSSYTNAISKELEADDDKKRDYRVVIVKKGDTLSTLAEKYYGSAMKFQKIISANTHLNKQSHTLYVGKEIHIPY